MKPQKVKVIANEIESNGIISLENNIISLDMGITNQVIDFRDISVYDKKSNSTLGLILKNNKSIDLSFKDYLLLYKMIDDYMKKYNSNTKGGVKCPECEMINDEKNTECNNCGYPLKRKKSKIHFKKKHIIYLFLILGVLAIAALSTWYFLKPSNNESSIDNSVTDNGSTPVSENEMKEKSEKVFSNSYSSTMSDVLYIGYENTNLRCLMGCIPIEYKQNGSDVTISYEYDSKHIEFKCKESDTNLVCYKDDGTVYSTYTREK